MVSLALETISLKNSVLGKIRRISGLGLCIMALAFATSVLSQENVALESTKTVIPDGIYLYGSVPQAEQLGEDYMVLQVRKNQVQGVLYQVSSEYACFHGTVDGQGLKLAVIDPSEQTTYDYTVAAIPDHNLVADHGDRPAWNLRLEGYQPIEKVGDLDRDLLQKCLSNDANQSSAAETITS